MFKISFKTPIEIVQDGLKAVAMFIYPREICLERGFYFIDGNKIDPSLIKGVEWEA